MNVILADQAEVWLNLHPLTLTRPVASLRLGILTLAKKWEKYLNSPPSYLTSDYLSQKFQCQLQEQNHIIFSHFLPDGDLVKAIQNLNLGESLHTLQGEQIAAFVTKQQNSTKEITYEKSIIKLEHLWQLFELNGRQIQADFDLITQNRESQEISDPHTIVYNPENIFLEEGVKIKATILNAENGVIYLGKNAQIQEGAIIQGPTAIGENAVVNMGAKIRANTTIGTYSKVGGEINNCIFWGYSNKGHDGFLGNSIIGQWCNFGADTNNSNLKNNYNSVKLWNYQKQDFIDTQKQFCGLFMGDHSKTGINTMLNTGTVMGVNANVFGAGFPPKYIPSFSWGGFQDGLKFDLQKAFETAENVMKRRNVAFDEIEKNILTYIYENEL